MNLRDDDKNVFNKEVKSFLHIQSLMQKDLEAMRRQINLVVDLVTNHNDQMSHVTDLVASQLPLDCSGAKNNGDWRRTTKVRPPGFNPIYVQCDQETAGGGWTVVVHRKADESVFEDAKKRSQKFSYRSRRNVAEEIISFNRTWEEYKNGFGDPFHEYWIGNEVLHALTKEFSWEAAVVLHDWYGNKGFAQWGYFKVHSEASKYKLEIGGYDKKSKFRDGLIYHNGKAFSTHDMDNDVNGKEHCAERYGGGWWFNQCHVGFLTGKHLTKGSKGDHSVHWRPWKGSTEALKSATLMIRPPQNLQ